MFRTMKWNSNSNQRSQGRKKVRGKGKQIEGNKQPKSKMFSLVCEWGNFLESQDMLPQVSTCKDIYYMFTWGKNTLGGGGE